MRVLNGHDTFNMSHSSKNIMYNTVTIIRDIIVIVI